MKPTKVTYKGKTAIVYDYELMLMMIQQWKADGLTKEECMELIVS